MKHAELQAKKNNQTHKLAGCCEKKWYFGMSSSTKWSVHESLQQMVGRLPKFEWQEGKTQIQMHFMYLHCFPCMEHLGKGEEAVVGNRFPSISDMLLANHAQRNLK